jgi:hypothetical protein
MNRAKEIALNKFQELDWKVMEEEDAALVNKGCYAENPEGLEYYKQAEIDKWVICIYAFPEDN